jgi:hypothetical protein
MKEIREIDDFRQFWPDDIDFQWRGGQINLPCPFCLPDGEIDVVEKNGIKFVGDDRFHISDELICYCRVCAREGRGRGGKGVYLLQDIAKLFSSNISIDFNAAPKPRKNEPLELLSDTQIIMAHAITDREYWYDLGWTDEIIDRFKLGYFELYPSDGPVYIIPMEVRTTEFESEKKWFAEGRPDKSLKGEISTKRTRGSSREYFWHIHEGNLDDFAVLVEGAKDAITAYMLGYRNIFCTFGTTVWTLKKTRFIKDFGYTKFIIFGDNDPAGERDLNLKTFNWATKIGLDAYSIRWTEDKKLGFDISDLLLELGVESSNTYINSHLYKPDISKQTEVSRPSYIADYREVDPYYEPKKDDVITLDEIRGDGDLSLRRAIDSFISSYKFKKRRGRGLLLLLNAPPGSGKTHVMVEVAEKVALRVKDLKTQEYQKLVQDYEQILQDVEIETDPEIKEINTRLVKNIKRRLDNFSYASILWATQYKSGFANSADSLNNPDLWFEFKARSPENCENYKVASTLGQFNHNVGAYCNVACPLRDRCKQVGYLSQEMERKHYPITVVRHQHLKNEDMINDYRELVLIDESPLGIIDSPMIFSASDFKAHVIGWEMEIADNEMAYCINILEQALRSVIRSNKDESQQREDDSDNLQYMISGSSFFRLLDAYIKDMTNDLYDVIKVVSKIDLKVLADVYQPNFINGDIKSIQKRAMPYLFEVLQREITMFKEDSNNDLPTFIHLVSGRLELYESKSIDISSSIPVIISDATATLPELYQAGFSRSMEIYSPKIRNPNANVVVVSGSDWTRSELEQKLGRQIKDRKIRQTEYVKDVVGDKFYLNDIPQNPDLYEGNKLLKDYEDSIYSLVEKHESLLVVVHKKIRDILEDVFKYKYPAANKKIQWGHYGALRGTNQFKDIEAVILLGVARIPYDVIWRKVQSWAGLLEIKEPIPYSFIYKPRAYEGHYTGHTFRTFEHPFAQRFVDMVEEGEMIQSMERIRPHSTDDRKFVYIFASRPVGKYINQVTTKNTVLSIFRGDSSLNRVKNYIEGYYKTYGNIPSQRETSVALRCGYDVYKQALELTIPKIDATLPRIRKRKGNNGSNAKSI